MCCYSHMSGCRLKLQPGILQPTQMDGSLNNRYRSLYFPRGGGEEAGMVTMAPAVSGIVQFI